MAKWTKRNNPHTWSKGMARRRTTSAIVRYSAPRTSKPIVIRTTSAPKHKKHRRRHGAGAGSLTSNRMFEFAIGGAAFGFISKQFGDKLPTLPLLGRSGSLALGLYFFGKGKGGLVRDMAIASAVIAGYEMGTTGHIAGDLSDNVSGIAAQV